MSYACKILTVDGGGIRGVIPAYILQQLEAALGMQTYQCFTAVGGTSTGGLIALALTTPNMQGANDYTAPMSATNVLGFYQNDEAQLFVPQPKQHWYDSQPSYYSTANWMSANLPLLTLSEAQKGLSIVPGTPAQTQQVFTTCYNLNVPTPGPYIFNWESASAAPGGPDDYYAWEAALGTSSAPTYFPIASVGSGATNVNTPNGTYPTASSATFRWVTDGGLIGNDPAMFGLAWAIQQGYALSDILLVSLGTGVYNGGVGIPTGDTGNWGDAAWGLGVDMNGNSTTPLISALGMSNQQVPDMLLQQLLPQGSYYRLEPTLTYAQSGMDSYDVPALMQVAQDYIAVGGDGYNAYQAVLASL